MSHFTKCKTKIKNKDALLAALADVGYTHNKVEINDTPQNLYGYQGDKREQTAEIILRRRYVGGMSNDIGFKLQEDGTYEAIISEYDSGRHNEMTKVGNTDTDFESPIYWCSECGTLAMKPHWLFDWCIPAQIANNTGDDEDE